MACPEHIFERGGVRALRLVLVGVDIDGGSAMHT